MIYNFLRLLALSLGSILLFTQITFAASIENPELALNSYKISYQTHSSIGKDISIDVSDLDLLLQENFSDRALSYEWDIYGQSRQEGLSLTTAFESPGDKLIQLSVYSQTNNEKTLIYSSNISIFIYEKSLPLLVSNNIDTKTLDDFIRDGKDMGVHVEILGQFYEENIPGDEVVKSLEKYKKTFSEDSDYLMIWGEKEFLFSGLSKINNSLLLGEKLNFVLVSGYNTSILQNYIGNNIAGKDFINTAFIIDDTLTFQTLKNPQNIKNLQKEVENNSYSYTLLSQDIRISPILFMSQFINRLSNMGVSTSDIYIILLLPVFLTCIGFAKHMIGISTLGSIIPIFITLLYIKMGIIFILGMLLFLLFINILISRFISKYTLLYTPKVSFITIINILIFMIFYNLLWFFDIVSIPIDNILYLVLFFIVAEKLITIITSKEFREYKKSVTGTVIVSLLCLMIYSIEGLNVFLMAYPEILIILVPINFFLGRFTGLRITEYLRFREIIKGIEEEE